MATHSDGDFRTWKLSGPPDIRYPLIDDETHFIIRQKVIILASEHLPNPIDQKHPHYPAAFCVGDESHTTRGPMLEHTRIWSTIPKTTDRMISGNVSFPAVGSTTSSADYKLEVSDGVAVQNYPGKFIPRSSSLSLHVPIRIHSEYFLPGISGYRTVNDFPIVPTFRLNNATGVSVTDAEATGADPDETAYVDWIKTGVEICVRGTRLTRYRGNIWRAETAYARAR